MPSLQALLADPLWQVAVLPFGVAFIVTLMVRVGAGTAGHRLSALGIAAGFVVGYYILRSGFPGFPPPQAVEKVFYIVLGGLVLGFVLDLAGLTRLGGHVLAFLIPIGALYWLRQTQIAAGFNTPLIVTLAALFLGSVFVYWRQAATARGAFAEAVPELSSAALFPAIQILVAAIGLGGITILSFSPGNGQLAMALAAACGGYLLLSFVWHLFGRRGLGYGAIGALGAGGAWLALVYVSVFAADADIHYVLIGVVALTFVVDLGARPLALHAPLGAGALGRLLRPVLYGAVVAIPSAAALAYAWFVLGWRLG